MFYILDSICYIIISYRSYFIFILEMCYRYYYYLNNATLLCNGCHFILLQQKFIIYFTTSKFILFNMVYTLQF